MHRSSGSIGEVSGEESRRAGRGLAAAGALLQAATIVGTTDRLDRQESNPLLIKDLRRRIERTLSKSRGKKETLAALGLGCVLAVLAALSAAAKCLEAAESNSSLNKHLRRQSGIVSGAKEAGKKFPRLRDLATRVLSPLT